MYWQHETVLPLRKRTITLLDDDSVDEPRRQHPRAGADLPTQRDGEDDEGEDYEPLVHGPSPVPLIGGASAQVEKPYVDWLRDYYHMNESYAEWYAWRNVDVNGVEW